MLTPDFVWRANVTKINIITRAGNKRTTPRGIDMLELPFNRNGLLKNAHLGEAFVLIFTSSSDGRFGDLGSLFITLCTNPIETVVFAFVGGVLV